MNASILVLTLNESVNLPGCLASVAWSDDLVVLDSGSSDGTIEIARSAGARVVTRRFDDWSSHQNWALGNIDFKNPWVFYIDADERVTPELREEIQRAVRDTSHGHVAFFCGRKNYFQGRWLRHSFPPGAVLRLFLPRRVRFERLVNPRPIIKGSYGYLRHHLEHYNFSKGLNEWIDKHNRYSDLEALETVRVLSEGPTSWRLVLSQDAVERRASLKRLSMRLPGRPILKFLYLYLFRLGLLDGRPGLHYCLLQAFYEYLITLKASELRMSRRGSAHQERGGTTRL